MGKGQSELSGALPQRAGQWEISCLKGELPFQEKLNVDGAKESDQIAEGEIEDLTVGVINSRKLSIRAVAVLSVRAEEELDEELTARPQTEGEYEQKLVTREGMTLLAASRDVCRQKSETVLPSSKPNVREILWRSIELRNVESRIQDGKVLLDGEVLIAVLYSEEEETERLQWYETTVPLECGTDCGVEEADVICKVKVTPVSMELEVKPDYDGEERILVLELALHVDIRVWREERLELLEDVYSLKKKLVPVYRAHFRKASGQKLCKKQNCRADRASQRHRSVFCRFAHVRGRSVWSAECLWKTAYRQREALWSSCSTLRRMTICLWAPCGRFIRFPR